MSWEEIPQGDVDRLSKYAKMMCDVVPQCNLLSYEDMKRFLRKTGDYFDYKDDEHEIVLGFTYANGKEMWKISQLAFKGLLNREIYRKIVGGIVDFMKQKNIDKVYAVRPKLPDDNIMKKFYDRIEDSTYWKIIKEKGGTWTLPLSGAVEIKGE